MAGQPVSHRRSWPGYATAFPVLAAHLCGESRSQPRAGTFWHAGFFKIMRIILVTLLIAASAAAQSERVGKKRFSAFCAACHGADAMGGERGPAIVGRDTKARSVEELRDLIRKGIPAAGMPAFNLPQAQLNELAAFVHGLQAPAAETPVTGDVAAGAHFFMEN